MDISLGFSLIDCLILLKRDGNLRVLGQPAVTRLWQCVNRNEMPLDQWRGRANNLPERRGAVEKHYKRESPEEET
jgi:hypothetical protein